MSDEPSNAASEVLRNTFAFFTNFGPPREEVVRAGMTGDFAFEDRRSGPSFPDADGDSYLKVLLSMWQTDAGRPEFEVLQILDVRGERFAAAAVRLDYGNGMLRDNIIVTGLDATLSLRQRQVNFDIDDADAAIAELDRLQSQADEG